MKCEIFIWTKENIYKTGQNTTVTFKGSVDFFGIDVFDILDEH